MLICQIFHVGPIAAPHMISKVPSTAKNAAGNPEEPHIEGSYPKVEQVAAEQGAAADSCIFVQN